MSNGVVGKNLIELSKWNIRRRDRAEALIVACRYNLEEQIRALSVQAHVTELVNDQDLRSSVFVEFRFKRKSLLRLLKMVHHLGMTSREFHYHLHC